MCLSVPKASLNLFKIPPSLQVVPYFGERVLLVGASLNGGNCLSKFVEVVLNFLNEFLSETNKISEEKVWSMLIEMGMKNLKDDDESSINDFLICKPVLFGERHDKQTFASISNIKVSNLNIASIFNSICKGIIQNLCDMITFEFLFKVFKCKRVICTGSGVTRNPILKHYVEKIFRNEMENFDLIFKSSSDSAIGAAYFLRDFYKNH